MNAELCDAIERIAPQLSTQVLDVMYLDPFWNARYGARGRKHAEADSRYHISYLLEALRANDARVLTRYAGWLRSVLVSRGMSSAHLAENFELLGRALRAHVPDAQPAVAMLEEARTSLRHQHGLAGWLERNEAQLLSATRAQLAVDARGLSSLRDWFPHLVDACALGRIELFVEHVRWLARFRGAHAGTLEREFRGFELACDELPGLAADELQRVSVALHQAAHIASSQTVEVSAP